MKNLRYLLSVLIITIAILGIGWLVKVNGTPDIETGGGTEVWMLGPEDAAVTLDVYPDFLCAICLEKERYALQAVEDYPGQVRVVYHPYPDKEDSETIAEALEYAGEQGKFWDLHNLLVSEETGDIAVLVATAQMVGLDPHSTMMDRLKADAEAAGLELTVMSEALSDDRYLGSIRDARADAVASGVMTVGIYINGQRYDKGHSEIEELYAEIDAEIERLGAVNE